MTGIFRNTSESLSAGVQDKFWVVVETSSEGLSRNRYGEYTCTAHAAEFTLYSHSLSVEIVRQVEIEGKMRSPLPAGWLVDAEVDEGKGKLCVLVRDLEGEERLGVSVGSIDDGDGMVEVREGGELGMEVGRLG